jgi:hypothetical protein
VPLKPVEYVLGTSALHAASKKNILYNIEQYNAVALETKNRITLTTEVITKVLTITTQEAL